MPQFGWPDCPHAIRQQVEAFGGLVQRVIGSNLLGVYLHGSLAFGCFNPGLSDLDLLVVVRDPMQAVTKQALIPALLGVSLAPAPVEVSFLATIDLNPWRYPTPFQLHYSEAWRERYEKALVTGQREMFGESADKDPDLAVHITVLRWCGVRILGEPVEKVFPLVPHEHYVASMMRDFEECLHNIGQNPVYCILNILRVWLYLAQGKIASKDQGGTWGARVAPEHFRGAIRNALAIYRGETGLGFDPIILGQFAEYAAQKVRVDKPL